MSITQITHSSESDDTSSRASIDSLLSRQSHWPLVEPGPSHEELDLIFDAALRAPDHGNLRPWRFTFVRDEARAELAELLIDIAAARAPHEPRSAHEHRREKAYSAPVIIVVAAAVRTDTRIPEFEQILSGAAAAMNMLNAIHALGYGGFWATGDDTYDKELHAALDFEPTDRILGFIFVGSSSACTQGTPVRPPRSNHVREWLGRSSV